MRGNYTQKTIQKLKDASRDKRSLRLNPGEVKLLADVLSIESRTTLWNRQQRFLNLLTDATLRTGIGISADKTTFDGVQINLYDFENEPNDGDWRESRYTAVDTAPGTLWENLLWED